MNNTTNSLYVISSFNYPDTTLAGYLPNPKFDPGFRKVAPNELNSLVLSGRSCIEYDYNRYGLSDTLMVYVLDANVVESEPWESITSDYKILKRYDLSLQDWERMNWILNYP